MQVTFMSIVEFELLHIFSKVKICGSSHETLCVPGYSEETCACPSLQYAQAIKGIATGRGIGIIDTVHLMEVAQSLLQLEKAGVLSEEDINGF